MGGGGGGDKNMTQSTKIELPAWYEPTAQAAVGTAKELAMQPYQNYPGSRVMPFTPEQELALQQTTERALAGSPVLRSAQENALNTLSGKYLDPGTNPAWDPITQRLSDAYKQGTAAQTNTMFSRGNAFGDNSAYLQQVANNNRAYGDVLGGVAGDLYNTERGYQNQMTQFAPQLAAADYGDFQALAGVGDVRRQYGQDLANVDLEDWSRAQNYGMNQLQQLGQLSNIFLGNQGSTTTTGPNPYRTSPIAGALGGGMLGYGLGSMVGGGAGAGMSQAALAGSLSGGAGGAAGGATAGAAMSPYAPWIGAALGALAGGFMY